jgi:hypothetical protein
MDKEKSEVRENDIGALIRKLEHDYVYNTQTISKYVQISMKDILDRIDAYLNSKFIDGDKDSLGRDKPFFNIVTAAVNIWFRSTDIDRKNIRVKPTKSKDVIDAFLATVNLQYWMKKINFGSFLNDWGRSLARYGSSVVKFVEKDGELHSNVIAWNRLIVDPIDFENNPKIEILELTEGQLRQNKNYDQDIVDKLCDALTERRTMDGQTKDQKNDYIKLYEIHLKDKLSYLTGNEEDAEEYVQQMQVLTFVASKEEGKFDDFVLFKGREEKDPYMLTHLIREDGRTLSIGAVEHLFEAQWMMNHTMKSIKDQLDLASKLIFQTSDGSFVGQNALSAIETGDILIHATNQPLTQLANSSHDITSLQSFGNQWKALSNEITGISESMLGNAAPSGTAWRQVETLLQQNQSLFELMTENKSLHLEDMLRIHILPWVKKKMDTSEEVVATLEQYDIQQIDSKYIKNESIRKTNKAIKSSVIAGDTPTTEMQAMMTADNASLIQNSLTEQGNTRFFKPSEIGTKTWKELFEDLEWELDIDISGESVDKEAATTFTTLLTFFANKQGMPLTPDEKLVVNKLLSLTGAVSPLELSFAPAQQTQAQTSPLQPEQAQTVT